MNTESDCVECMICCEKYNKQLRSKVVCNVGSCGFNACKSCIRQYLMSSNEDIHCMSCRKAWDNTFVILKLNRSWFITTYMPHQVDLLFERNKSKTQEVMPLVEIAMEKKRRGIKLEPLIRTHYQTITDLNDNHKLVKTAYLLKNKRDLEVYNNKCIENTNFESTVVDRNQYCDMTQKEMFVYENKKQIWRGEVRTLTYLIAALRRRIDNNPINNEEKTKEEKVKKQFIMPCQHENCNGFLTDSYKCGLCEEQCCKHCFEMLGTESDMESGEKHECNKDLVDTAKLIKTTTKPCPKCGQRIYKISGCDQMWCVECKCSFSWKAGTIITKGIIHNPHYFQYMREANVNGAIPRQPGDNPCNNGDTIIRKINSMMKRLVYDGIIKKKKKCVIPYKMNPKEFNLIRRCDILLSLVERIRHTEHVDLPSIRQRLRVSDEYQDELVKYITEDISETLYKGILQRKWKDRKKQVDKGYLAELFVNVGNDIINEVITKWEGSTCGIVGVCTIDEFVIIMDDCITKLNNFMTYHNDQYNIISVSHNCAGKVLQYAKCSRDYNVPRMIFGKAEGRGNKYMAGTDGPLHYKSYELVENSANGKIRDVKNK